MLVIAIDGACRRNGKPDCISAGGVFVQQYDNDELVYTTTISSYEVQSTNQRGEMHALIQALNYAYIKNSDAQIVTDSEYLFNAMTKGWINNWHNKHWVTASGEPVKNRDLWEDISAAYENCMRDDLDIIFYHIKGHVIPFGKVTANTLLSKDTSGRKLLEEVYAKYFSLISTKKAELEKANKLSLKNNGFELPPNDLRRFIAANIVVDAVATRCVEDVDALCNRQ